MHYTMKLWHSVLWRIQDINAYIVYNFILRKKKSIMREKFSILLEKILMLREKIPILREISSW